MHKQCTSFRCCSFPYNEEIHHQKGKFSAQHSDVNSLISLKEVISFIFESHSLLSEWTCHLNTWVWREATTTSVPASLCQSTTKAKEERQFVCGRSVAGMCLRRFPTKDSLKKIIRWKTTMDRVFNTTFKRQSLKFVVWCVKGSDFQKEKDYTIDFESCFMVVWAIDIDDVIGEGCKRPVEEHKRIG